MASQSTAPVSSSELFDDIDNAEFNDALLAAELPGDIPIPRPLKRTHSEDGEVLYTDNKEIYGAASFGGFGEYMSRKRAKLQIQNTELVDADENPGQTSQIFKGLSIYVDGLTIPSIQELRKLILQHGGIFQAYLDRKGLVTHIITSTLTPTKIRDLKMMKIARPEWLVDSAAAGILLPWKNYIYTPEDYGGRATQGTLRTSFLSTATVNGTTSASSHRAATPDNNAVAGPSKRPKYAAHASNPNAQRAMADSSWRAQHTSANSSEFIQGYYENSRLHHLSVWKAQLRVIVGDAQRRAEEEEAVKNSQSQGREEQQSIDRATMAGTKLKMTSPYKGKGKAKQEDDTVIMHVDFDCFFVSAGLTKHPHLRGKPVVVCHSQGATGGKSSTSEIASCSYEARAFGVKNGMSLQQARQLCPKVQTLGYDFELYKELSLKFYTILMSHADDLQAVSVDEALIEVSSKVARMRDESEEQDTDSAKDLAEIIRTEIREATGCEASIGIAHNILLARLATGCAKPAGSHHVLPSDSPALIAPLDISKLWGIGHATRKKAEQNIGTTILGEMTGRSRKELCDALGKSVGEMVFDAIRGVDKKKIESDKPRKSVSAEINYGIRFENNEQAKKFVEDLAVQVTARLNEVNMLGRTLTVKIMKRAADAPIEAPKFLGHGACDTFNKQVTLLTPGGGATSDSVIIADHAWKALKSFNFDPSELRGIGLQILKLESGDIATSADLGQSKLKFVAKDVKLQPKDKEPLEIQILPPSSDDIIEVPGPDQNHNAEFGDVDPMVLEALPEDIRREIEAHYQLKKKSPSPIAGPSRSRKQPDLLSKKKISVAGTNYKRIAQQLAPKTTKSGQKNTLFDKKNNKLKTTDEELQKLGIDPEFFAALDGVTQFEQLSYARAVGSAVLAARAQPEIPRIKILADSPEAKERSRLLASAKRRPPPEANIPPQATLKQKRKGGYIPVTETEDVQRLIESWVHAFRNTPPNEIDIKYFETFLVRCADGTQSTDVGVEKTVKAMKWWLVLLRRNWAEAEDGNSLDGGVGQAWWAAFRQVRGKVDVAVRKKFGGSLSLK